MISVCLACRFLREQSIGYSSHRFLLCPAVTIVTGKGGIFLISAHPITLKMEEVSFVRRLLLAGVTSLLCFSLPGEMKADKKIGCCKAHCM